MVLGRGEKGFLKRQMSRAGAGKRKAAFDRKVSVVPHSQGENASAGMLRFGDRVQPFPAPVQAHPGGILDLAAGAYPDRGAGIRIQIKSADTGLSFRGE